MIIGRLIITTDEVFYIHQETGECFRIMKSLPDGGAWCQLVLPLPIYRLWWIRFPAHQWWIADRDLKPLFRWKP